MQCLQLLLASSACAFSALRTPEIGACAGPTERASRLREAYPSLPKTMCPLDQMACEINGSYDCFQCCPDFNRLNEQNENCPRSYVCGPAGTCVFPNETETFMKKCESNVECGQMSCVDGRCALCRHGEWTGRLSCVGGLLFGLGARPFTDPVQIGLVIVGVFAIVLWILEVFVCTKSRCAKNQKVRGG